MPAIRSWWRPLALYTLVLPIAIVMPISQARHELQRIRHAAPDGSVVGAVPACHDVYRTPDVWPPANQTASETCLDTGYYIGVVDAITPDGIQRKIDELDRSPRKPILLFDVSLDKQMEPLETDIGILALAEGPSLFTPRIVRSPLNYLPIFEYIGRNYLPDSQPVVGSGGARYRVWRPKNP